MVALGTRLLTDAGVSIALFGAACTCMSRRPSELSQTLLHIHDLL